MIQAGGTKRGHGILRDITGQFSDHSHQLPIATFTRRFGPYPTNSEVGSQIQTTKKRTLTTNVVRLAATVGIGLMLLAGLIGNARTADPGDLDTDFRFGGLTYTNIDGASGDQAYSVAIQADDKIVVAGSSTDGIDEIFAVVRYSSTGTLDTSFGATGIVTTPIGSGKDVAYAVAIQSDGKILVAGSANNTFVLRVRGTSTLYLPLVLQSNP